MVRIKIIILFFLIIVIIAGCGILPHLDTKNLEEKESKIASNTSSDISNNGTIVDNTKSLKENITEDDFNIEYNGTTINDSIDFSEIMEKLGIASEVDNSNIDIKAMTTSKGYDYSWYILHYPSRDKEEICLEYIVNETLNTRRLVHAELLKYSTNRGIKVGDNVDKLISLYGSSIEPEYNTATTNYYRYKLNKEMSKFSRERAIWIIVDNKSENITEISLDYGLNEAMEEVDIVSFD